MATISEMNEFEALAEFFRRERQKVELQGTDFTQHLSDNANIARKFRKLKELAPKYKQFKRNKKQQSTPSKNHSHIQCTPHITTNRHKKNRKRIYSAIKYDRNHSENDTNTNTNPRKRFKHRKYTNNAGFSPSLNYNKPQFKPVQSPNTESDQAEMKQNSENISKFTSPNPSQNPRKSLSDSETKPILQNITNVSHTRKNNSKSKKISLKERMKLKSENTPKPNPQKTELPSDSDIEMRMSEIDISDSDTPNTNRKRKTKNKKKTKNKNKKPKKPKPKPKPMPKTAKKTRKITVRKKKTAKTAKKAQTTKCRTKKAGAGVSKNFVRMDLKHNSYRRKGRGRNNNKKNGNSKWLSKWEWKEQQRQNRIKRNNLNLENDEQMRREIYSDSDDEQNNKNNNAKQSEVAVINPYFDKLTQVKTVNNNTDLDALLTEVLQTEYGYSEYRNGQREAIKKILNHESVLLLLSTGFGKSLCYQIPTILCKNNGTKPLTLVISPLISLMHDQCENLPKCLKGAVWNSSKTTKEEYYALTQNVINGVTDVLFIAPEKLDSNYFRSFLRNKIGSERLMFACIDEAHCISEWSHNFRPSYLKLKHILIDYLGIKCILACTATATVITQKSITNNLGIDQSNIVLNLAPRNNLHLSVSHIGRNIDKHRKLSALLCTDRFKDLESLIVYASTRREVEEVALKLSLTLKRRFGTIVEAYHAGKKHEERQEIQSRFMKGEVNIIVATIAFGMGINKSDIRGVIHYSMPKTMEHYVQEIGRAGRDGRDAECHVFYDLDDLNVQKSRIYMNGVDLTQIKRILCDIFSSKNVKILRNGLRKQKRKNSKNSKKKKLKDFDFSDEDFSDSEDENELILEEFKAVNDIVCMHKNSDISKKYDCKEVVLNTIFTYLDVYKSEYIKQMPSHHNKIRIGILTNKKSDLWNESEIMKFICNFYKQKNGEYIVHLGKLYNDLRHFDIEDENGEIIDICANNWSMYQIIRHFKDLDYHRKIRLHFDDPCFVLQIKKEISDHSELMGLCDTVYEYVSNHEKIELEKINTLGQALKILANNNDTIAVPESDGNTEMDIDEKQQSPPSLHELVDKYFQCETHDEFLDFVQSYLPSYDHIRTVPVSKEHIMYAEVRDSILKFMGENGDVKRARSIAKIFHGFGSPLFPWKGWKQNHFWKKHINFPFLQIIEIAKEVVREKRKKKNNLENNNNSNNRDE